MKKKWGTLLLAALLAVTPAALAELELDGTVQAGSVRSIAAPYSGTVGDFDVQTGDVLAAGTQVFPIAAQKVYAEFDGVVTGLFAQPGDNAATIENAYGALCYIERGVLFEAACSITGSDGDVEDKIVHPGETVYLKSTQNGNREGVGRVTRVQGETYTVEIHLVDGLRWGETVKIYRDSDHDADSCIGTGKTSRIDPMPITAQGYVLACRVTDGQAVSRGDVLFEIVPDPLAGMKGGEAAAMMPEDGIVLSVSAQSGAQTAKDAVLATYCPAQDVELVCPVDEEDLPAVKIGARVHVVLEAYEDAPIEGEVVSISSAADENDEFAVTVKLLEDANVRIGMSATVEL